MERLLPRLGVFVGLAVVVLAVLAGPDRWSSGSAVAGTTSPLALGANQVYVPSLSKSGGTGPAMNRYDFETADTTKQWVSDGAGYAVAAVSRSTDISFDGSNSLKVEVLNMKNGSEPPLANPGNVLHWLSLDGAPLASGNTVVARVYVPSGAPADLQGRLFVQYGVNNSNWYPAGPVSLTTLSLASWTTLQMTLPVTVTGINTVGVQVVNPGATGWSGAFYVDAVNW